MDEDRSGASRLEAAAVRRARRQQKRGRKKRRSGVAGAAAVPPERARLRVVAPVEDLATTRQVAAASADSSGKRDKSGRQRAPRAGVTATQVAPTAGQTSARRAPKHAQPRPVQAAPPSAPQAAPTRPPRRRLPPPSEQADASGRKYPTLAHISTPAAPQPRERTAPEPKPSAAPSRAVARTEETHRAALRPVPEAQSEAGAETSAAEKPPVARAPRPTVALRRPPVTRRLRQHDLLPSHDAGTDPAPAAVPPLAPPRRRLPGLPEVNVVVAAAGIHAGLATLAALTGATLLILGRSEAVWPLALAVLAGIGGWLGYTLAQSRQTRRGAGYALLASQLGMLGWLLALVGPRAAVLALAPVVLLLALHVSGRLAALIATGGSLALYLGMSVLTLTQIVQPGFSASPATLALVDACLVSLGALGTLAGAADLRARQARAEAAARARHYELRVQRSRLAELRQHVEDDAETLAHALTEALRGRGIETPHARGALSPLAGPVEAAAERMATLQRDREDRLRLEAALRVLIHEVERAWLGLPWVWPRPSGTQLDELIALLRAPRPVDAASSWGGETPTLVPIPTLDSGPLSRDSTPGTSRPDLSRFHVRTPALPWSEWDEWSGWDPTRRQDGA